MTTEVTDQNIAVAAAAVDASSSSPATISEKNKDKDHDNDNEPSSVKGMLAALHKHSDGSTNYIKSPSRPFPTRTVPTKKAIFW
jgi:hypothetical protein